MRRLAVGMCLLTVMTIAYADVRLGAVPQLTMLAPRGPLVPATLAVPKKTFHRSSPGKFLALVALDGQLGRTKMTIPPARKILMDSKLIDRIADNLNATFVMPRNIPVSLKACGDISTHYSPGLHSITLCDEWLTLDVALRAQDMQGPDFKREVLFSSAFAFCHEVGHALIHELNLKITGYEEDVADQLAVYLLAGTEFGAEAALSGADTFWRLALLDANDTSRRRTPVQKLAEQADVHSPDARRVFGIVCWTYGSDERKFAPLSSLLPRDRSVGCHDEFDTSMKTFDSLLRPHFR